MPGVLLEIFAINKHNNIIVTSRGIEPMAEVILVCCIIILFVWWQIFQMLPELFMSFSFNPEWFCRDVCHLEKYCFHSRYCFYEIWNEFEKWHNHISLWPHKDFLLKLERSFDIVRLIDVYCYMGNPRHAIFVLLCT